MEENKVGCGGHGIRKPAFVCQHLNVKDKVGFNEPFKDNSQETQSFEEFRAWCNRCEEVRESEGEWNDASEGYAKIKMVCHKCFFEMKRINMPLKR